MCGDYFLKFNRGNSWNSIDYRSRIQLVNFLESSITNPDFQYLRMSFISTKHWKMHVINTIGLITRNSKSGAINTSTFLIEVVFVQINIYYKCIYTFWFKNWLILLIWQPVGECRGVGGIFFDDIDEPNPEAVFNFVTVLWPSWKQRNILPKNAINNKYYTFFPP